MSSIVTTLSAVGDFYVDLRCNILWCLVNSLRALQHSELTDIQEIGGLPLMETLNKVGQIVLLLL